MPYSLSLTGIWPGSVTEIHPPKLHINEQSLVNIGMLANNTVGSPMIHGVTVTGIQGIGVNTPIAVAVAAATAGFAGELHMPNGNILTNGAKSKMLATGVI